MNFQKLIKGHLVAFGLISVVMSAVVAGQAVKPTPTVIMPTDNRPAAVARGTNLYCAGYIQQAPMATGNRIIGSNDEADKYNFSENDFMYINMGSNKGVNVGDTFSVVRPRGKVRSRWTSKSDLGFYVQEVGALEVIRVKADVAVARVKSSCDSFLLGDLVQLVEKRQSPLMEKRPALDLFGDSSGKVRGRIVLTRDHAELLTRDFIAYVDLGNDDNVTIGDRLTVFRPLGKGNLTKNPQVETASSQDQGFDSNVYQGGRFSNQTGRREGDKADGRAVTTGKAKEGRPELRKVVGEAVVINVKERTATIVITRTAQEIHPGDWVEIQ